MILTEGLRLRRNSLTAPIFMLVIAFGVLATALYFIEFTFYDGIPSRIWPRGVWLLSALAGIVLIPIRVLRLLGLIFLVLALSPLTLLMKGGCANFMSGCDEDEVYMSGTTTFTDQAGKEIEVEYEGKSPFFYPIEALSLEGEAEVTVRVSIEANGKVVVTSTTSSASDMRSAFENSAQTFFEGWQTKILDNQNATYPLEKDYLMPFFIQADDGKSVERPGDEKMIAERFFPLGNLIFNILVLFVVALLVSINSGSNLSHFSSYLTSVFSLLGIPYGLYLIACNFNFMIAGGVTTNYTFLAHSLMLGGGLILLGFFVDRIYRKSEMMPSDISLGRETLLIATILLALGPLLDNSSTVISDVTNWFPTSNDDYFFGGLLHFWTWLGNTFTVEALFFGSFLGVGYFLYRIGWFSLEGMYDVALIVGTVGIAIAIILWFTDMSVIAEDYVYIFSSLSTASAALTVCSLAFCLFGLSVIRNPSLSVDRARKNLLLTELFVFFLFFAYAPISVSELGQSFEIDAEKAKREEDLLSRVKDLEEKLGIFHEENEND